MTEVIINDAYSQPFNELEIQMKQASPDRCIALSHSAPSVQMFYALRSRLEACSEAWMQEYLELDGLENLLDWLCQVTGKGFTSFSDAILQLDCISCVRAILNTSIGLDYMIRNETYVKKLALALNIGNTLSKKQVFEMLSAICVRNSIGYHSVLSALSHVKRELDLAHRFSIVVNELKAAETVQHKTAILTFINCIMNCTTDILERNRIRTEFTGINLLDVLCFLRKEEVDDDLHLQLETFHEKKHDDEEALSQEMGATDFNSPEDLIEIIQSKIFGSAKMASFVNILQDLLSIDLMYSKNSVKLWKVIEDLVHETVHTSNKIDVETEMSAIDLESLPEHINVGLHYINRYQTVAKYPPDQLFKKRILMQDMSNFNGTDRMKYDNDTGVELTHNKIRYDTCDNVVDVLNFIDHSHSESLFYNVEDKIEKTHTPTNKSALQKRYKIRRPPIPPPTKKMKSFKWVKLSDDAIDYKLWELMSWKTCLHDIMPLCLVDVRNAMTEIFAFFLKRKTTVDYGDFTLHAIEKASHLFVTQIDNKHNNCIWLVSNPSGRFKPDYDQLEKMFQDDSGFEDLDEVVLLNAETRRNVNLFLSRVDMGPEDLLHGLESGNLEVITLPVLHFLQKILPQQEEIDLLQGYSGRRLDLGMPEQFLLLLADIPEFITLIQGYVTQLEYAESMNKLKSSLEVMLNMCKIVLDNQDLREFFHFVLNAGNFLNHGCLQGDAAGFKLSSLERMINLKSNVPNQTLLHHIIKLAHQPDEQLLSFLMELLTLEKKSSSTLHDLKNEISRFNKDLSLFIQQLSNSSVKMKDRFHPFIEEVRTDLLNIQISTRQLRELSNKIASYFCEDERKFNLEDTLQCILRFCKLIRKCHNENATFYKQSHLAKRKTDQLKMRLKNKHLALEFGKEAGACSSILEDRNKILEKILDDLHRGNFRPVIKSEIHTPEAEPESLEVSHISLVGSPYPIRPSCETLDDEELFNTPQNLKIRTSSAADILSDEPRPVKQEVMLNEYPQMPNMETFGYSAKKCLDQSYFKPFNRTIDLIKNQSGRSRGHNRSRSDLADSILSTEKWMKYEEMQLQDINDRDAPLAEPESNCIISTLNLDLHGKFVDSNDVKIYEESFRTLPEGPIKMIPEHLQLPELRDVKQKPKSKTEKRFSVSNLVNKFSKHFLKPKNDAGSNAQQQSAKQPKEKSGKLGRRKILASLSDKENIPTDEDDIPQIDKKQTAKENKRQKMEKSKSFRD